MGHPCVHYPDPTKSRRDFLLQSAACGAALLLPATSHAGKLHEIGGEVMINGRLASRANEIRALDVIKTGTSGRLVLVVGKDAFLIRANSEVEILGKPKALQLTGLRMLTGALLVWRLKFDVFPMAAAPSHGGATAIAGLKLQTSNAKR